MTDPIWVQKTVVLALHEMQLAEHGGLPGLRDEGLLDSALARPQNLFAYETPDIAWLAASYGYGLAKNHPFADGNKRVSLVVTELFLDLNGHELDATDQELLFRWESLAGGGVSEAVLADWLRPRLTWTISEFQASVGVAPP